MYATIGIAVGYFSYRKGMTNLQISMVFRPLIGDRVNGPLGKTIDVIAILATLFGVAVSLGLGTLQIAAGLNAVFGIPSGIPVLLVIIAVTAVAYMLSASTPLEKGVNILSQASMYWRSSCSLTSSSSGRRSCSSTPSPRTRRLPHQPDPQNLRLAAFDPQQQEWLGSWTIFFWATWIAWGPYVGAFIARISRGRTIREFIVGVLIGPSMFSMIWFSVFGAAGIQHDNATTEPSAKPSTTTARPSRCSSSSTPTRAHCSPHPGPVLDLHLLRRRRGRRHRRARQHVHRRRPEPEDEDQAHLGSDNGAARGDATLAGGLDALNGLERSDPGGDPVRAPDVSDVRCLYKTIKADYREEREQIRESWRTTRTSRSNRCKTSCAATKQANP